jgi:MFS family permease
MSEPAPARLPWYRLVAINLFWLALNMRNSAVGTIFLPFLVDKYVDASIRNTALGGLRTAGLIIAMLVQPAMGILSDRSTSRWGRRRPFILAGALLDIVFLTVIVAAPDFWWLVIGYALLQFSANVSHGPLQGLIPDQTPEAQRGVASAIKSIFELLPLILLGFTVGPLVQRGQIGWANAFLAAVLVGVALLTLLLVQEKPLAARVQTALAPAMLRVLGMLAGILAGGVAGLAAGAAAGGLLALLAWFPLGQQNATNLGVGVGGAVAMAVAVGAGVFAGVRATLGAEARAHPSFTWWIINRLLYFAAVTSIQGSVSFFLMFAFNASRETAAGMTGALITAVGVFTLLSALPAGWLSDRFGQVFLTGLSGWLAAAGTALILVTVWLPNLALIYIAGAILGVATGLFTTTNWALGTRLAPPEQAGRYLGISNLAGAGAGIIGAGIGGPVADILNNSVPGLGFFAVFAAYGLLFVLSALSLRGVRQG